MGTYLQENSLRTGGRLPNPDQLDKFFEGETGHRVDLPQVPPGSEIADDEMLAQRPP